MVTIQHAAALAQIDEMQRTAASRRSLAARAGTTRQGRPRASLQAKARWLRLAMKE
jgi:hypothetical protein